MELVILVVIYKTSLKESETIISLIKANLDTFKTKVVIWDNSPNSAPSDVIAEISDQLPDLTYISSTENTWLSKVYNRFVSEFRADFFLILDQDTTIPQTYFEELKLKIINSPEVLLFLPIVRNSGMVVSPGSFRTFKGKHWKSIRLGQIESKNTLAITSGMAISREYFTKYNYKFDERLSLYGIDTKFMLDFAKNELSLIILESELDHQTVLWSQPPAEVMLVRYKNLRNAWRIILSDRPINYILYRMFSIYSQIKLAFKYRDRRFLNL